MQTLDIHFNFFGKDHIMKTALCTLIAVVFCATTYGADWSTEALTNADTDCVEIRLGKTFGHDWEGGLLGTWYTNDYGDQDTHSNYDGDTTTLLVDLIEMARAGDDGGRGSAWGLGGYLKMSIDRDASLPLAGWLNLGDWLNLPQTITPTPYFICKGQVVPYDGDADIVGGVGVGCNVGPATVEWVYNVVEQGEMRHPAMTSGAELWFGARLEF